MSFSSDSESHSKIFEIKTSSWGVDTIQPFYFRIEELAQQLKESPDTDELLVEKFEKLRECVQTLVQKFNEQRPVLLKTFDSSLVPIAKEILEGLFLEAQKLKCQLDDRAGNLDQIHSMDWAHYIKEWSQLYLEWIDHQSLSNRVLKLISERTSQLIDKDLQVIQDYQSQSLVHLSKESEVFKNLENRLAEAIAEPLKQLSALRNQQKNHTTLKQASEWVSNLQEQRERYFDQLLMKIDHVVKEVVQVEDLEIYSVFSEDEGDIQFMESEIHHIQTMLPNLKPSNKSDIIFMETRLEGLLDHAEQIDILNLTHSLQKRLIQLKDQIALSLFRLKQLASSV